MNEKELKNEIGKFYSAYKPFGTKPVIEKAARKRTCSISGETILPNELCVSTTLADKWKSVKSIKLGVAIDLVDNLLFEADNFRSILIDVEKEIGND